MSIESAHYVNMLFGIGSLAVLALSLLAIIILLFRPKENKYLSFIKNNFLGIGLFISLSAFLVSLFYSEVMHYVPCFHCWVDRILIFPQAVIFAVALSKKDKNAFFYSMWLTLIGLGNALYHIFLYYFSEGTAPCDASGVSCVQRLVSEFGGLISIPSMAFIGFFGLGVLLLVVRFYKKAD